MKYQGNSEFTHSQVDKVGVLITNLGTPDAPQKKQLRAYLKEFLSDPRVVEVPRLIWWFILNLVILNIRPSRSAKAYKTVWTERGSPLMYHTQDQAIALRKTLQKHYGEHVIVEFAMRYGAPSVDSVIDSMLKQGVRKLVVLPLYPQYCASTTASTFDAVAASLGKKRWMPELQFITHYHDNPDYIQAVADKIRAHWQLNGQADKLIFSFHGIPKRYLLKGDPYHCECYKTSRLIAQNLGLDESQHFTSFQSRFGREEWLKPYTDSSLRQFAKDGIKSVQVVCPGFSADCLETIEEIAIENRDYFLEAGGQSYQYIEALNADTAHIDAMSQILKPYLSSMINKSEGINVPSVQSDLANRQQLAKALGAEN
ncbi:ferrochelatase [Paraglaciecola aquimarina]|uniref:Ferrochelatase n=1 Tax=Paraglaciecola aquimarina TaxID=1235557 RepID=A0ABU3SUF7_9ALTE|nr:ferrochelatase [Paraglaciecola aquimarina]MDU0353634.1 ferrochelatase [Paraglaciecola aquimarina]